MAVIAKHSTVTAVGRTESGAAVKPRERILSADLTRCLAIIMVVVLHTAGSLDQRYTQINTGAWWAANLLDSLSRQCVPLFFMISGYFLLGSTKAEPLGMFFRKRVTKVVIPFIAWAAFYLLWRATYHLQPITLADALKQIAVGPVYFHLWFVYTLIGLYLAAPIMRIFVQHAPKSIGLYFLGLWFINAGLLPVLDQYFGLRIGIEFFVVFGELGFFVGGALLRDARLTRRQCGIAALLFLLAWAFTTGVTGYLTVKAGGKLDAFFYNFPTPNVIIMAFALFLIVKSVRYDRLVARFPRFSQAVTSLSSKSLGIYFVHVLILELMQYDSLLPRFGVAFVPALLTIIAIAAGALLISYAVIALMQRLPLLRVLVP